ncbi:hypothetical protein [Streptomyces platensis]|uniref:hypothetical protein n=1 Tax=Streptomyces platensis TaxID=58346 RepID=UPI00379143AE
MPDGDPLDAARLAGYGAVSTDLSMLSDHRLKEVVASAVPLGSGIGVPPGLAALLDRHARPAVVMDVFHRRLLTGSKRTPFPAAELGRALAAGSAGAGRGNRPEAHGPSARRSGEKPAGGPRAGGRPSAGVGPRGIFE